jgi:ABC-type transport system substrate-binding protein
VYDTLFGTDESLQIKPQMIEQTSVSANGMKYMFSLRNGLRWHDGQPVRSEDCVDPAVHFAVPGAGPAARFGWPQVPRLEKLTTDWVRATDQVKRKQVAEEIQKVALDEVTYVPWGEWFMPMACRKNVHGTLKFTAPVFWNVTIT